MKFPQPIPISELAAMCGAEVIGDVHMLITGLNEIHKVTPGDLMFVDNEKYYDKSLSSAASAILINKKLNPPAGKTLLYHTEPFKAYNSLAWHFRPFMPIKTTISESAHIDPTVILEPGVIIGPYVRIGAGSHIQANVYIGAYTEIGEQVVIEPNTVIGSDAFYFHKKNKQYTSWRSIGRVIIKDHVYISASCTIVRGVSGDTIIGEGSKLDCQVHVGHGTVIGAHCLIAAQTAIGGKVKIEDFVTLYGQVGIAQNVTIKSGAIVLAKTGVSKDIDGDGQTYFGILAQPAREYYKQQATLKAITSSRSKQDK